MYRLWIVGLTLLAALALAQKPLEFPVDQPFKASLPLRGTAGEQVQLSLAQGSSQLELVLPNRAQSLTIGTLSDGFEPKGAVLAADFNFDGWLDLAVPMAVGYGGVNYFYEIYFYNPRTQHYELLGVPGAYDGQFCNPEISQLEKILLTSCKSGPSYNYTDYRFVAGKPYVYRTSQMFPLAGFTPNDVVYATHFYEQGGKLVWTLWNDNPRDHRPARRTITQARVYLYDKPDPNSKTKTYLVKGDPVEVVGVSPADYAWVRIAYKSRQRGRVVAWVYFP